MQELTINPDFKQLIPPLSNDEYNQLEQNIIEEGCREAIIIWNNTIIDGHNRYEICTKHNISFEVVEKEFDDEIDVKIWIIRNQLGRRNLQIVDRVLLVSKMKPLLQEKAKRNEIEMGRVGAKLTNEKLYSDSESKRGLMNSSNPVLAFFDENKEDSDDYGNNKEPNQSDIDNQIIEKPINFTPTNVRKELAKIADVSEDTFTKVEIIEKLAPDLIDKIRSGKVSIHAASQIATLPKDEQEEIIAKGEAEILQKSKEIRQRRAEARRSERIMKLVEISAGNHDLSVVSQKFPVIYADPPWRYDYTETESRAIENQYPTMSLDEICALEINSVSTDDCVLFLWTTSPKLEESFRVIHEWGFTYRTCAVWDKEKIGMGYYFRQQHELLLVATKGNIPAPDPSARVSSVFRFPRGSHSEKPEEVYSIIEKMYPELPKLELFCRTPRDGWSVWGNQCQ